jgi:hypothetical protein
MGVEAFDSGRTVSVGCFDGQLRNSEKPMNERPAKILTTMTAERHSKRERTRSSHALISVERGSNLLVVVLIDCGHSTDTTCGSHSRRIGRRSSASSLRDLVGGLHRHRNDPHLFGRATLPPKLEMAPSPPNSAIVVLPQHFRYRPAIKRSPDHRYCMNSGSSCSSTASGSRPNSRRSASLTGSPLPAWSANASASIPNASAFVSPYEATPLSMSRAVIRPSSS